MERYIQIVEPLLTEDYATLDIAAALLKMTMDEENKEYPQLKEYQQERQTRRKSLPRPAQTKEKNQQDLYE